MPISNEREARPLKAKVLSAIVLGGLLGSLTLVISRLSSISENPVVGTAQRGLFTLLIPGIIGAGAVSGSVHAWSLWIAAGINMLIYFVAGWIACWLVLGILRRQA
jgi:hypothetical protein